MANKVYLVKLDIGLCERGLIKTDQDLTALAPFTSQTYFSRDKKKAYGNWTLDKVITGSFASGSGKPLEHPVSDWNIQENPKH